MLKVAAVCSWSEVLKLEENIKGIARQLNTLHEENVQYALFPELSVSGYINNTTDLEVYARQHQEVLRQLLQLSEQSPIIFSVGLPMPLNKGFGIAQLTWHKGQVVHQHFKTHLSVHEQATYQAGDSLHLDHLSGIKTGMQLCLETHYPELSLLQQQQGAQLLCMAYASPRETPEEKMERLKMIWQARAYDNACFVMACNQTGYTPSGKQYAGVAAILSPRGEVLAQYQGLQAGYCTATIDLKAIEKIRNSVMSNFPAYRKTELKVRFLEEEQKREA